MRESTCVDAAVSPGDGALVSLVLPDTRSAMMALFSREADRRHPEESILIFMDQAGWPRGGALQVPDQMRPEWLPPYSPECNPAGHLWGEIREKWFGNTVFESLEDVEAKLAESLSALERDPLRVMSLTGFDWVLVSL